MSIFLHFIPLGMDVYDFRTASPTSEHEKLNLHQELIRWFLESRNVSFVYGHTILKAPNLNRSVSYANFKIFSSQSNYFFILMILSSILIWKSAEW